MSDAGDGGKAVGGFLQFLRLRGRGLWDCTEAEWGADAGGTHVAWTQGRILSPVTLHNAWGVGRQTLPCAEKVVEAGKMTREEEMERKKSRV